MNVQEIIGSVFLVLGLIYGAFFLKGVFAKSGPDAEPAYRSDKGDIQILMALEALVYFLCTLGISDFLMNTLVIQKFKLVRGNRMPATLIACAIVPGSIIAFSYLRAENELDLLTLAIFMLVLICGSFIGSRTASRMKSSHIKKIMGVCLIFSMVALVVKMILSGGASGTAIGLSGYKLVLMAVLFFGMSFINMMGVPMKPASTALLLLLGLSPIATLTMVQILGVLNPIAGGINVVREAKYNKKLVLSAVTVGSVFAILGVLLAISLSPLALNVILLIVMAVAIFSLLRPRPEEEKE